MKILSIPNENGKMTCFWEEGVSSGKKPLIICLADKEEDAQRDLNLLFSQANGASVAALVVYTVRRKSTLLCRFLHTDTLSVGGSTVVHVHSVKQYFLLFFG